MYRLILLMTIVAMAACSQKKKSLSGEDVQTSADFTASFPEVTLPFVLSDTTIDNKLGDSALINTKLIRKFIPDSLFRDFKGSKPKYYALGRAMEKEGEQYIFIKAATQAKQLGYLLVFDKESNFKAGMPLVSSAGDRDTHSEGGLDRKFTITRNKTRKGKDGQTFYRKNVYIYNNIGTFMLILEESNEALEEKDVYNPIDTLPMTGKWSGNYVKDRKNFVTVRDGAKDNRILFFIHFETNNGECTGELKGEAEIVKPGLARYTAPGDPCALELSFTPTNVSLSELKGCGNYRGIRCFFSGSYPKKAVPKKKRPRSK